jgi:mRNA interferase ChpB
MINRENPHQLRLSGLLKLLKLLVLKKSSSKQKKQKILLLLLFFSKLNAKGVPAAQPKSFKLGALPPNPHQGLALLDPHDFVLQLDPASGREMKGDHFCLVVSPKAFNQRFKRAMVCPISGAAALVARDSGFLVPLLGAGLKTDGGIHAHQIKSLDWAIRKASLVEKAPTHLVSQVLECLQSVLEE